MVVTRALGAVAGTVAPAATTVVTIAATVITPAAETAAIATVISATTETTVVAVTAAAVIATTTEVATCATVVTAAAETTPVATTTAVITVALRALVAETHGLKSCIQAGQKLDQLLAVLIGKTRDQRQLTRSIRALIAGLATRIRDTHGDGAHILLFGKGALDQASLLHLGQVAVQLAQAHAEEVGNLALLHLVLQGQELEGARLFGCLLLCLAALVAHGTHTLTQQARRLHQGVNQAGVVTFLDGLVTFLLFKLAHEATAFLLRVSSRDFVPRPGTSRLVYVVVSRNPRPHDFNTKSPASRERRRCRHDKHY